MGKSKSNNIALAKNEEILKEYNYTGNGSKLILTNRRIISHVASGTAFDREEMPIEDVHSIGSSFETITKRKGPAIIMLIIGAILAAAGYVFGFNSPVEIAGTWANVVKYAAYGVLGIGAVLALIGLIKLILAFSTNKKVTLSIRTKGNLTDCISVKASTKPVTKKNQGADSSDEIIIVTTVNKKDSLNMVNEIGAMILDLKDELAAQNEKTANITVNAAIPQTVQAQPETKKAEEATETKQDFSFEKVPEETKTEETEQE